MTICLNLRALPEYETSYLASFVFIRTEVTELPCSYRLIGLWEGSCLIRSPTQRRFTHSWCTSTMDLSRCDVLSQVICWSPVTISGIGVNNPSPDDRSLARPAHFRMQHDPTQETLQSRLSLSQEILVETRC